MQWIDDLMIVEESHFYQLFNKNVNFHHISEHFFTLEIFAILWF